MRKHLVCLGIALTMLRGSARAAPLDAVQWFQKSEQSLMDAVASGDRAVWDRILDPSCILTSEEGQVMTREQFLAGLRPLPTGLTGGIAV
jgi:hypothetical protein